MTVMFSPVQTMRRQRTEVVVELRKVMTHKGAHSCIISSPLVAVLNAHLVYVTNGCFKTTKTSWVHTCVGNSDCWSEQMHCALQNKRDEHLLKRRNVPHEDVCDDSDADGDFRSVSFSHHHYSRVLWFSNPDVCFLFFMTAKHIAGSNSAGKCEWDLRGCSVVSRRRW